jgi:hypothetical protein
MNFSKLNVLNVVEVKNVSRFAEIEETEPAGPYKTRIMSDGKVEATDTIQPA